METKIRVVSCTFATMASLFFIGGLVVLSGGK